MGDNQFGIYKKLVLKVHEKVSETMDGPLLITGVHSSQYCVKSPEDSFSLELSYLVVTLSNGAFGVSYHDKKELNFHDYKSIVGEDSLQFRSEFHAMNIANLDALASKLIKGKSNRTEQLTGNVSTKSLQRSQLIVDECKNVAKKIGVVKPRICCIGIVPSMLRELSKEFGENMIHGCDSRTDIKKINSTVQLSPGIEIDNIIRNSDIAVVTGMTLANNSISKLLEIAKYSDTKLIIYSQTGPNLFPLLLDDTISTVLSESFPFYLINPETCLIDVYRSCF